jgi:hypothetical protein
VVMYAAIMMDLRLCDLVKNKDILSYNHNWYKVFVSTSRCLQFPVGHWILCRY